LSCTLQSVVAALHPCFRVQHGLLAWRGLTLAWLGAFRWSCLGCGSIGWQLCTGPLGHVRRKISRSVKYCPAKKGFEWFGSQLSRLGRRLAHSSPAGAIQRPEQRGSQHGCSVISTNAGRALLWLIPCNSPSQPARDQYR
jgi:hypothetical protein